MQGGSITRSKAAFAAACLLAAASPAFASTIYRCEGADGSRSYVSKRVPGAQCVVASRYRPERAPRPAARPAAASSAPAQGTPPATFMGGGAAETASTPAAARPAAPAQPPVRRLRQGQVYSYVQDGVRHYSSTRPAGTQVAALRTIPYSLMETCYACAPSPGVSFSSVRLNTTAYADEIASASRRFGVEEAVIRAIMHAESAYNPNALSHAGAQGLMQLMPATAARFGVVNAFDPAQNIRGGVEYLAWLLRRFNGDLTLAAAGYNAGEGAVDRHNGVPPYGETRRYVERVRILAERYRGQYAAN